MAVLLTVGLAACVGMVLLAFILFREAGKPPTAVAKTTAPTDPGRLAERRPTSGSRTQRAAGEAARPATEASVDKAAEVAQDANRLVYAVVAAVAVLAWAVLLFGTAAWMVRDCRNRSADSGFFWGALLVALGLSTCIGGPFVLVMYLTSRPNGQLVKCRACGNRRLSFVTICPHCKRSVSKTDKTDDGLI